MMIRITDAIALDESEITEHFIRSPGPGGQNVKIFRPIKLGAVLDNVDYLGWRYEAKALSFNGKTARQAG